MKFYLFLAAVVAIFIFAVYFSGYRNGVQRCRAQMTENVSQQQTNIIKIQEEVYENLNNRGVNDIRGVLREKYTVAK